jgi:hypothetical protein
MQTAIGLFLLFLFSTASIAFGSDRGGEYLQKGADSPSDFQVRLARVDLWSYLLTSVPLVGGLMILLGSDPAFIMPLKLPDGWRDAVTCLLGMVASVGVGLGLARRRWALRMLKEKQAKQSA